MEAIYWLLKHSHSSLESWCVNCGVRLLAVLVSKEHPFQGHHTASPLGWFNAFTNAWDILTFRRKLFFCSNLRPDSDFSSQPFRVFLTVVISLECFPFQKHRFKGSGPCRIGFWFGLLKLHVLVVQNFWESHLDVNDLLLKNSTRKVYARQPWLRDM